MFNNSPSADNEYILGAISYFPFVSLLLIFTIARKQYFVKYHAAHAIILYTTSLIVLLSYIGLYVLLRGFMENSTYLDLLWGLVFSIHILTSFIYLFYCSLQAFQGRYLIIPGVTKLFYLIFQNR